MKSPTETVENCLDATMSFSAEDGSLVVIFREAPDAPLVTLTCGYGACEWVLAGIDAVRKRIGFDRLLPRDVAKSEDGRVLFVTIEAKRGKLEWEVSSPFGIAGWRLSMERTELAQLRAATVKAMKQEDAKP